MKSIKLNFIFNMVLNLSKVVFPLITAPYVARVLEPDGIGLFNFANTYASYFALFAALGIPTYGVREISKDRTNIKRQSIFVSEMMSLSLMTTLICSSLFFISLFFIPQLNRNFLIFLISGIILYVTPLKIDWFFSGHEEFGYITLRSLVVKFASIICLFVFVREKSDLIIYVFLNAIAAVINEIWNFIKLFKYGIRLSFTIRIKKHIKPLLILFSTTAAVSVYTVLDTIMLGFMREYNEVAFYNSASHISKSLLVVSISLATVTLPRISYYLKNNNWNEINSLLRKSFSVILFFVFPITFGVVSIASEFIPLFFFFFFLGAIIPLQIMMFVVIAIGCSNLTGIQLLIGLGYDKYFLYAVIIGAIVNISLNLILIASYGASGAALASVVAEFSVFFVCLYYAKRKTSVSIKGIQKDFIFSLCGAMICFPVAYLLKNHINGWIYIFTSLLLSGSLYLTFSILVKNSSALLIKEMIISRVKK